jgi:hypothetical protein
MKLAALSFFLLLVYVHWMGDVERLAEQPLSMFRDDAQGLFGYALFATLLLVSVLYVAALVRSQREAEAVISAVAAVLLLTVALTPSRNGFHLFCSLFLLSLLFGYYAVLLYRAEPIFLILHLIVPLALAFAIQFDSYGLWQKSIISYFVFLAALHHHVLTYRRSGSQSSRAAYALRQVQTCKRRKVFRLEPKAHWRRRGAR